MFVKLDKNVKTATCSLMDSKYETEFFFLAEILKNKTRPKFCGPTYQRNYDPRRGSQFLPWDAWSG